MSGVSMKISVLDEGIERFLKTELARMGNLRPFYVNVGEHLLNSVQERFDTQTAPDGTPWQRLAPSTVENRLRKYGNAEITILRERGRMAGSFNYRATDNQVEVGTPMEYAAIHHHGGQTGRNHAVTMPARPVLGITAKDEVAIGEMAEDFLRY